MTLNKFKCNCLMTLHFKGLIFDYRHLCTIKWLCSLTPAAADSGNKYQYFECAAIMFHESVS